MAAKAALRPFQTRARSCSDWATRISQAPLLRHSSFTARISSSTSLHGPSSSTSSKPLQTGIMRMYGGFRGLDGQRVHDLHRRRQHPGGDDVADGLPRGLDRIECGQQGLHHFRPLDDAQRDFRGHAQRPFRPDEYPRQVVAGCVQRGGAQLHQFARGQHHIECQNVGGREAVFQAMRAAGILRHVAADGAHRLRRRIGRIEVSLRAPPVGSHAH